MALTKIESLSTIYWVFDVIPQNLLILGVQPGDLVISTTNRTISLFTNAHILLEIADIGATVQPGESGVVGNGVADDTAAIQAKINALDAVGGGVLNCAAGTYLAHGIVPCDNLWIRGSGWGTIFKRSAGGGDQGVFDRNYQDSIRSNIIISDLKIDGNGAVCGSGRGLNLEAVYHLTLERLWAVNSYQANIQIGHPNGSHQAGKYRVLGCLVQDGGVGGAGWGNIGAAGGDDLIFSNNILTNDSGTSAYSIDLEPNNTWKSARVIFSHNIARNGGLWVQAVLPDGVMREVIFSNNMVDARNAAGNGPGIKLQDVSGRCYVLSNDVVAPLTTSPGIVAYGSGITMLGVGENTVTGIQNIQGTTPDHVGMQIYGNAGFIRNNHIQADAPTHATLLAGIDGGTQMKVFGNTFENITVPFPASFRQSGSLVLTAALPAASAQMVGVTLIEDAGASVYHRISYISPTVRLRDLTAF